MQIAGARGQAGPARPAHLDAGRGIQADHDVVGFDLDESARRVAAKKRKLGQDPQPVDEADPPRGQFGPFRDAPDGQPAGRSLGLGPWQAFFRVSLPMAWRGIVASAILLWTRALGIFGPLMVIQSLR